MTKSDLCDENKTRTCAKKYEKQLLEYSVIISAFSFTISGEFDIAIPQPTYFIISISLSPSPIFHHILIKV